MVSSSDPNNVFVISLASRFIFLLESPKKSLDYVYFSKFGPDTILGLSTKGRGVRIWKTTHKPWDTVNDLKSPHAKVRFNLCHWNCDESRILALSTNGIYCWDSDTYELVSTLTHPLYTDHCLLFAPHPNIPSLLFVACVSGRCAIWDINTGNILTELVKEETIHPNEAIWSADGQYLFLSDWYGGITIFGYSHKPFSTTEMYFDFECSDDENPFPKNEKLATFVDSEGLPLLPQPKKIELEKIDFEVTELCLDQSENLGKQILDSLLKEIPKILKVDGEVFPIYMREKSYFKNDDESSESENFFRINRRRHNQSQLSREEHHSLRRLINSVHHHNSGNSRRQASNSESSSPPPRRQTRSRGNRQTQLQSSSTSDEYESNVTSNSHSDSEQNSRQNSPDDESDRSNDQRGGLYLIDGVITRTGRIVRPTQRTSYDTKLKTNEKKLPRRNVPVVSDEEMHSSSRQQNHQKTTIMKTRHVKHEEIEQTPEKNTGMTSQRTTTITTRKFRQTRNFSSSDDESPKRKATKSKSDQKRAVKEQTSSSSESNSSDSTTNSAPLISRRHFSSHILSSKNKEESNHEKNHKLPSSPPLKKNLVRSSITDSDPHKKIKIQNKLNRSNSLNNRRSDIPPPRSELSVRTEAKPYGNKIHRKLKLTRNSVITLFTSSESDLDLYNS